MNLPFRIRTFLVAGKFWTVGRQDVSVKYLLCIFEILGAASALENLSPRVIVVTVAILERVSLS